MAATTTERRGEARPGTGKSVRSIPRLSTGLPRRPFSVRKGRSSWPATAHAHAASPSSDCSLTRGCHLASAQMDVPAGSVTAWPAGGAPVGVDLDGDGHLVGDDVVDRRAGSGLVQELAQLLGRGVALDREAHRDLLVAIAHGGVEPEDAVEVDVAADRGADLGELDLAGGGDVGQAGGEAGGQRVQHELHGGRSVVLADQDGGVVGVEDEGPLVGAFLSDPVVVGDGAAVVGAADPLVVGAELEAGCLGRLLHGVEGGEQGRGVHAVADRVVDLGGVVSVVVIVARLLAVRRLAMAVVRSVLSWVRAVASFRSAVVGQAVTSRRSPGIGRAARAAAWVSMAALSCFCSSMNVGTGG